MNLSGQQAEKLQQALISAFPTKSKLEQMLKFKLSQNLDTIAGGSSLEEIVFNLIIEADSKNWIKFLIQGALKSNPDNSELQDIAEELFPETPPIPNPQPKPVPNPPLNPGKTPQILINPPDIRREKFLKWAFFGGLGLGTAYLLSEFFDLLRIPQLQTFQFETVTVNAEGVEIKRSKDEAKYFVENLVNNIPLEMVQIPGGIFTMGSPEDEAHRSYAEQPQHKVKVPEFFMGKYAVTQAQYEQVMGGNPSRFKGENRPVEQVSWYDAVEFCKRLSEITGRIYRLPSEAEWEYACRATTTTPFHFGETITTDLVNYNGNDTYANAPKGEYRKQTIDVENFSPNCFGLYQMHGNTWEWCLDTKHDNYKGAPYDGSAWIGSKKNLHLNWEELERLYEQLNKDDNSTKRMLRGGSWDKKFKPWHCRSAFRNSIEPEKGYSNMGFRVVVSFPMTSLSSI